MVQKGILKAEQGGFRKMHGTVDIIITLKTLIDKYVKSKPQKHRNASSTLEKPSTVPRIETSRQTEKRRSPITFLGRFNIYVLKWATQIINGQLKLITS